MTFDVTDLPHGASGVLPSQMIADAVEREIIDAGDRKILQDAIQPASLDLRLGSKAYRLRCSFLPDTDSVEEKMKPLIVDEVSLRDNGAVLEPNRPYLIPLMERLRLPPAVRAKANPKSSTGRLDVFTRVITDKSYQFDEIRAGYIGGLYLEVVPLSFAVQVREGLALNQLRLIAGHPLLSDNELREEHKKTPLLYVRGVPLKSESLATSSGLFLSLDLRGDRDGRVGYRARQNTPRLAMSAVRAHEVVDYWEPVVREQRDRIVLDPERFYLLLSEESVCVPPHLASEMTAFDPTSGELRTHYAGFFDPGFGYSSDGSLLGSRAALEVRAHDVPFMIEHGQRVCKLTFERMLEPPEKLYGSDVRSHYQGQVETLSKHFKAPSPMEEAARAADLVDTNQLGLFDDAFGPGQRP
jgi:dCTP deaminase